jgi:hypothetical protein
VDWLDCHRLAEVWGRSEQSQQISWFQPGVEGSTQKEDTEAGQFPWGRGLLLLQIRFRDIFGKRGRKIVPEPCGNDPCHTRYPVAAESGRIIDLKEGRYSLESQFVIVCCEPRHLQDTAQEASPFDWVTAAKARSTQPCQESGRILSTH